MLRRSGTSQRKRIASSQLLRPEFALIDSRKLGDMLDFVYEYARLIVFHEYKIDAKGQGHIEFSNWLVFFERSLPFTLNWFAKRDFDRLETDLRSSIEAIKQKPNDASLHLLLDFCYFDLIKPLDRLQQTAREFDFVRLVTLLDRTTRTSLLSPLRRFIELSNVAAKYFCTTKYDFKVFAQTPWDIPIEELFVINETVADVPGGQAGAIEWLGVQVTEAAQRFVVVQRNIAQEIPDFLNASIDILEKRNDPHLGLLYAFLRLFEHFQGELNALTQKHIEFFYIEVLRLKRRDMVPDQVHLIFEPAKHLKSHLIKQGTIFKDAKDSKNADILFDLDEEIVTDKAKVAALKTLYLNHSQGCLDGDSSNGPRSFVEGLYIAPIANSADGKGEEFKEEQSKNWATLGARLSKYTAPGDVVPQNHPFGRIGFILASPVLWLNEGQRDVTITIECDASKNKDLFNSCFQKKHGKFSKSTSYKITDETIKHIEKLFCEKTRKFLHEEFTKRSPLRFSADEKSKQFLNIKEAGFTQEEKNLLTQLMEKKDGVHVLKELPFMSLLQQLRLQKDREFISSAALSHFFQTTSCYSGGSLIPGTLHEMIQGFFEKSNKFVLDISEFVTVHFSGEDGWFQVSNQAGGRSVRLISTSEVPDKTFNLCIDAKLSVEDPKVAFYSEKTIGEPFETEFPFPMVRIELKPEIQFSCENLDRTSGCCLEVKDKPDTVPIGLYHLFRFLTIVKTDIDVKVSGLQNLVVQNEESLQDINSVILPFGSRPKLKADFFIGSKELLCKDWKRFQIGIEWKDKPDSLAEHYRDYGEALKLEIEPLGDCDNRITDEQFEIEPAIMQSGEWVDQDRFKLFMNGPDANNHFTYSFERKTAYEFKTFDSAPLEPFTVNTRDAFIRWRLRGASFQHTVYPFALATYLLELARQVPVLYGKVPSQMHSNNHVNLDIKPPNEPYTPQIKSICIDYVASAKTEDIEFIHLHPFAETSKTETLFNVETFQTDRLNLKLASSFADLSDQGKSLIIIVLDDAGSLHIRIFDGKGQRIIDKTETELGKEEVMELKELLRTDSCQKQEIIDKAISISQTTLLPTFTDEGTLFIGLQELQPRSNLHLLFQFAEATANSESDRAEIKWHYLADNRWKELRTGFELLSDKTEQMTRSGIVKIALPEDISNEGNTLMPPTKEGQHLFWLKVSTSRAVAGVAELVGIHAQAALATYKPLDGSDRNRVAKILKPEQIGKTFEPDFHIKKIQQPYKSFGGKMAESEGAIPIRMSELLRHKGRSVDAFDIEHLVLDAFPEFFKCKCISHTMGLSAHQYQRDLEVAPGFLIVAVVPDLTKLEPGDMLQPMAPVSTLTKVKKFLKMRVSPFARIRVMNPRYEQIHVSVKVRLRPGRDKDYYLSQLKTDLRHFLAPWHLGDSDKLSFGQHLVYSDVLGFIERLEYIDFVSDLRLFDFRSPLSKVGDDNLELTEIIPLTARSILSPGDIEISSDEKGCKETPESRPNENRLAAFLESASPIICGEAQSDLAKRNYNQFR